ncbi:hypothetical protein [Acetobacter sp.]|uniref:hypothetical protein n=1 Tax=Acetobacter sp. TaxID=440 RepID=UPI0039EBDA89
MTKVPFVGNPVVVALATQGGCAGRAGRIVVRVGADGADGADGAVDVGGACVTSVESRLAG